MPVSFFDELAEASTKLGTTRLIKAARYAKRLAERLQTLADQIKAERRAEREAKYADRIRRWVDENGVLCMT